MTCASTRQGLTLVQFSALKSSLGDELCWLLGFIDKNSGTRRLRFIGRACLRPCLKLNDTVFTKEDVTGIVDEANEEVSPVACLVGVCGLPGGRHSHSIG